MADTSHPPILVVDDNPDNAHIIRDYQGQLRLGGGSGQRFNISGGFLQVLNNDVRVVTEKAAAAS